jgi:hypothetical protein
VLVCEHAERDEVSPLGRDRRAPCKLYPPDVVVASGGCERGNHLTRTNHRQIESGRSERHKQPPSTGSESRTGRRGGGKDGRARDAGADLLAQQLADDGFEVLHSVTVVTSPSDVRMSPRRKAIAPDDGSPTRPPNRSAGMLTMLPG